MQRALDARGSPAYDVFGIGADFDADNREVDRWVNLELRWSPTLSPRLQVMARAYLDLYDYLGAYQASSWTCWGSEAALPGGADPSDFTFRPESVLTGEVGYEQRVGRHRFFAGGFLSNFTDMVRISRCRRTSDRTACSGTRIRARC